MGFIHILHPFLATRVGSHFCCLELNAQPPGLGGWKEVGGGSNAASVPPQPLAGRSPSHCKSGAQLPSREWGEVTDSPGPSQPLAGAEEFLEEVEQSDRARDTACSPLLPSPFMSRGGTRSSVEHRDLCGLVRPRQMCPTPGCPAVSLVALPCPWLPCHLPGISKSVQISSWWDDVDGDASWFQGLTWGNTRRDWGMHGQVLTCCLHFPGRLVPDLPSAARCVGTEHLKTWLEQQVQRAGVKPISSLGSP